MSHEHCDCVEGLEDYIANELPREREHHELHHAEVERLREESAEKNVVIDALAGEDYLNRLRRIEREAQAAILQECSHPWLEAVLGEKA